MFGTMHSTFEVCHRNLASVLSMQSQLFLADAKQKRKGGKDSNRYSELGCLLFMVHVAHVLQLHLLPGAQKDASPYQQLLSVALSPKKHESLSDKKSSSHIIWKEKINQDSSPPPPPEIYQCYACIFPRLIEPTQNWGCLPDQQQSIWSGSWSLCNRKRKGTVTWVSHIPIFWRGRYIYFNESPYTV